MRSKIKWSYIITFLSAFFLPTLLSAQVSMIVSFSNIQNYLSLPVSLQSLNIIAAVDYLTVSNNSGSIKEVYFYGKAFKDGNEILRARSTNIQINPGETKSFNKNTYEQLYKGPGATVEYYDQNVENAIRSTGYLPNGVYNICIYLYSSDNILLQSECSSNAIVDVNQTAIQNTHPFDQDTISEKLPVFIWTPIPSGKLQVSYDLLLYESLDNKSSYASIKSVPEWYKIENINGYSIQYSTKNRSLIENQSYVWYVKAKDSFGKVIAQSEPTIFTYKTFSNNTTTTFNNTKSNSIYFRTDTKNIFTLTKSDSLPVAYDNSSSVKVIAFKIINSSGIILNKGVLPVSDGANYFKIPLNKVQEKIKGICQLELYSEKGLEGQIIFESKND